MRPIWRELGAWLGAIGTALTLLGNLEPLLALSLLAKSIVQNWSAWTHYFWSFIFIPFPLRVTKFYSAFLTCISCMVLLGVAPIVRQRIQLLIREYRFPGQHFEDGAGEVYESDVGWWSWLVSILCPLVIFAVLMAPGFSSWYENYFDEMNGFRFLGSFVVLLFFPLLLIFTVTVAFENSAFRFGMLRAIVLAILIVVGDKSSGSLNNLIGLLKTL